MPATESLATEVAMLRAENANLRARLAEAMRCAEALERGDVHAARMSAGFLIELQRQRPLTFGVEHRQKGFDWTGAPS